MMAISKWVYTKASGIFTRGGYYDPQYDPATEGVVEFSDADPNPDPRLERFDESNKKRPASPAEVGEYDAAQLESDATAQIVANPALTCGLLALHTQVLGRVPTVEEQASVFMLAKAYHKALMTAGTFPLPPETTSGIAPLTRA